MGIAQKIAKVDLFKRDDAGWQTGSFVGRPFRLSYSRAEILVTDAWKEKANGVPHGCFLLAQTRKETSQRPEKLGHAENRESWQRLLLPPVGTRGSQARSKLREESAAVITKGLMVWLLASAVFALLKIITRRRC